MAAVRNGAKKFTRIPAKWKDYSICGTVIPGERLVSFKTPLSKKYHCNGNEVDPEDCLQKNEQFTPNDLCTLFRKKRHMLGLVVDFTNTNRYYEPKEFTNRNIKYTKIKCEGKIVPHETVVNRFKATVLSYFKESPDSTSVVGVHCTHGLNRSGYIVCRYLIECRGYSPQEAIDVFNNARGHEMERENYLEDLQQRKPKILSEKDIENLIKTFLNSGEKCQPSRNYWQPDQPDGYHHRRDPHAPFRPEPPGFRGGKRHYGERFVQHRDYWSHEVNYFDDRGDGHHYVRNTPRYQRNKRRHNMHPYTRQERFPSHDGRSQYENGPRSDSQNDTISWNHGSFGTEPRGHDRRQFDHRDTENYHTYDGGYSRISGNGGSYTEYHRKRDDRNNSEVGHGRQLDHWDAENYHTYDGGYSRISGNGGSYTEYHRKRDDRNNSEVGHGRQLDHWDAENYRTYNGGRSRINGHGESYRDYHRERDDRNASRVRYRKPSEDYRHGVYRP